MNELDPIRDRDEILAELENILESDEFAKKRMLPDVLRFLVEQALQGKNVKEEAIWAVAYPNEVNDRSGKAKVRVAVAAIRKNLFHYYQNKGSNNAVQIELPYGKYVPTFRKRPQFSPAPPLPVTPARGNTRFPARISLLLTGGIIAVTAAVVCFLLIGHQGNCKCPISIIDPKPGSFVPHKYVVQATRASASWFCRCHDYLVVEAIDLGQWYVQGPLPDGAQPSYNATFGEIDTHSGTRFSIFVLSTRQDLPTGPLSQSSPLLEGAAKSPPIEVSLGSH